MIEGPTNRFIKGKGGCERAKGAYAELLEQPPEILQDSIKFGMNKTTAVKEKPKKRSLSTRSYRGFSLSFPEVLNRGHTFFWGELQQRRDRL
ncbi:MAG: hypothetical protein CM1200mP20_15410 [Pseudomonadota bacterium]|nr:MAG: hypothetical protein CM1200mP20_15410 [Pseudomonadota bacterium]